MTVRLEPAVIVNGKVSGLIEKPVPDRVTLDTTRSAVPEFVTVTIWLLVVPTVTLVKLKLLGETLTDGDPAPGPGVILRCCHIHQPGTAAHKGIRPKASGAAAV